MIDKKRGLGRGLQDLFGSSPNWLNREDIQLFYCPIDQLVPNPYQPRQIYDSVQLEELVQSVREKGVLQPLIVTKSDTPNQYQVVAGERRWRAARQAGLTEIPVLLRESTPAEALEIALIENIQRQDLNCLEEAFAYKRLQEEFQLTQEEIAKRVGKERSTVANFLRLLHLSPVIQEHVLNGKLSMGHARALAGLENGEEQEKLAQTVIRRELSVRKTEDLVASAKAPQSPKEEPEPDPETLKIEERLRSRFESRVRLKRQGDQGTITISFKSDEEFQQLLRKLGLND